MTQLLANRYCVFIWTGDTQSVVGSALDIQGITVFRYQGGNIQDFVSGRNSGLSYVTQLEQWEAYMIFVTIDLTLPDTITGIGSEPVVTPVGVVKRNLVGINLPSTQDYEPANLWANVFKLTRPWFKYGDSNTPASVNTRGYPLENATCVVWAGDEKDGGTYRIRFVGDCDFSFSLANNVIQNKVFANGVTTADVVITGRSQNLFFNVQNIRSPLSDMSLMAPIADGSTESYPLGQALTNKALFLLPKFNTLRFMDWCATNGNNQKVWADRALPSDFSWQTKNSVQGYGFQGLGAAWESVIQICNAVGCNAWICVPSEVDDNYITNLATLLRDGNSAVAALRSDLKLYVEYTNEMWNFGFTQYGRIHDKAQTDGAIAGSPLNYNGDNDPNQFTIRQQAKRSVEVSNIFRSVFGDSAMGNRVRVVLQGQQYNNYVQRVQFQFLEDYYNNAYDNFVSQPHPASYFFYGAGGSGYYSPDNSNPSFTVTQLLTDGGMNWVNWVQPQHDDMDVCLAYGVNKVCYEGGAGLDHQNTNVANKNAAAYDDRMEQNMIDHYEQVWAPTGSKLLTYFSLSGVDQQDGQWSFTRGAELNTPKMRAVDRLTAAIKKPITYGSPIPVDRNGGDWNLSTGYNSKNPTGSRRCQPGEWYSYNYRSSIVQTCNIEVQYNCNAATTIEVYQGSTLLRRANVASSGGNTASLTGSMAVTLAEDENYAIRVRCPRTAVEFNIVKVKVT